MSGRDCASDLHVPEDEYAANLLLPWAYPLSDLNAHLTDSKYAAASSSMSELPVIARDGYCPYARRSRSLSSSLL